MADNMDIELKFWTFHFANPHVYELFKKYAEDVLHAGYEHYGIKAIFERVRWHMDIDTEGGEGFKLNNNYTSRYARLLSQEDKRFCGFFRNRQLKTDTIL